MFGRGLIDKNIACPPCTNKNVHSAHCSSVIQSDEGRLLSFHLISKAVQLTGKVL